VGGALDKLPGGCGRVGLVVVVLVVDAFKASSAEDEEVLGDNDAISLDDGCAAAAGGVNDAVLLLPTTSTAMILPYFASHERISSTYTNPI
jgi:hypothetical protein